MDAFRAMVAERTSAQLTEALESFPLPIFSVDTSGRTIWQNGSARALFGDLRGAHYSDVVAPEELPTTHERFSKALNGKPTQRARNVLRTPKGELVPVEVTTTPLREDGKTCVKDRRPTTCG